jgi:hypothetical protein
LQCETVLHIADDRDTREKDYKCSLRDGRGRAASWTSASANRDVATFRAGYSTRRFQGLKAPRFIILV